MDPLDQLLPYIPTILLPVIAGIYWLIRHNNSKIVEDVDIANDIKNLCKDVAEGKDVVKEIRDEQKNQGDQLNSVIMDTEVLKVRVENIELRLRNGGHKSAV